MAVHRPQAQARPRRGLLRAIALQIALVVVTLAVCEAILRVVDLRYLRESRAGYGLTYAYDAELGWLPVANSVGQYVGMRTTRISHNSLGLRDVEPGGAAGKTILFLGDSFVWGYDVEAEDRFTERLRRDLPQLRIVNGGIAGYGTDQQYLLLRRFWDRIKPDVVVLVFCTENDRRDNSTNSRYGGHFKPYLEMLPDGSAQFRGQPVPKSRHIYFVENPIAHHSWVARVAVSAFVEIAHPAVHVADPTERLIGMMRDFVQSHGARFMVGLQDKGSGLEPFLTAQNIPFKSLEGAEHYFGDGDHWTPNGHAFVAQRLSALLSETGAIP
jgi:GDSL-like lipase/acylhydrolase family protein